MSFKPTVMKLGNVPPGSFVFLWDKNPGPVSGFVGSRAGTASLHLICLETGTARVLKTLSLESYHNVPVATLAVTPRVDLEAVSASSRSNGTLSAGDMILHGDEFQLVTGLNDFGEAALLRLSNGEITFNDLPDHWLAFHKWSLVDTSREGGIVYCRDRSRVRLED